MTKSNTSTMFSAGKIIIGVFGVFVIAGFMLGIYGFMRSLDKPQDTNESFPVEVLQFRENMQNFVIENFGRPIDSGFTAPMYLNAFPGLMETDFDEVETSEGKYEYSNGILTFIHSRANYASTFDEAILEKGHETLLNNIRDRLGLKLSVDEIIKGIIAQGVGRASGTILLGPTCPVVKNPPDEACADKPIFGTFIVKDVAGINEVARFGTQRDGSFNVSLPASEYSIEPETPLGLPGIQAHRIEVKANETTEYTITFDTGIR